MTGWSQRRAAAWPTSVGASTSWWRSSSGSTRSQVRQVSVKPCRSTSGVPAPPRWDGVKVEGTGRQARWLDSPGVAQRRSTQSHGMSSTVVAALVAAGCIGSMPVPARAADPCRPGSERHRDGTRTVTECDDGRLVARRRLAVLPLDGGVVEKPLSEARPVAGGGQVQTLYSYGSTGPTPSLARTVNDSCTNGEFHPNASLSVAPWSARGYTYRANVKRMPHGDRDRRQITKGKHTWDRTRNGCGFGDPTNFKTRYGGRTSAVMHSFRDRINVVDFGSLAPFTRDRAVIALSRLWFQNRHVVEADTASSSRRSVPAWWFQPVRVRPGRAAQVGSLEHGRPRVRSRARAQPCDHEPRQLAHHVADPVPQQHPLADARPRRHARPARAVSMSITLAAFDEPYALLARLRASEPVAWVYVLDGWLVTRRDLAMDVHEPRRPRSRSTTRASRPASWSGPSHAHARRPRAPPPPRAVRRPASASTPCASASPPSSRMETERLIDAFEPAGQTELRRSFAGPLAAAVVMHALGLRGTDPAVASWVVPTGSSRRSTKLTKGQPLGARGQRVVRGPARRARAGARPRGGRLAGRPAVAQDAGGLEREAVSNAAVLMFGGIETTEGMIANAVLHLLENPAALAIRGVEQQA